VLPYTSLGDLLGNPTVWKLVLLVFIQVFWVTMVYGPIAAYLVEAFPAKIRYTALSLPYHIGNGVFGGLLPLIGLSIIAQTGNIYAGLYYPMIVAGITFVVGSLLLKETRDVRIWKELETAKGGKLVSDIDRVKKAWAGSVHGSGRRAENFFHQPPASTYNAGYSFKISSEKRRGDVCRT